VDQVDVAEGDIDQFLIIGDAPDGKISKDAIAKKNTVNSTSGRRVSLKFIPRLAMLFMTDQSGLSSELVEPKSYSI
jgi:hypothetical protein